MIKESKNMFRLAISLLLVFCLLSVVAAYEPVTVQHPGKNKKTDLLIPAFMGRANGIAILKLRNNSKSPNRLFKNALILEQTSDNLPRASLSFLTEFSDRFSQYTGQTTLTIRAPPCFNP